MSLTPVQRAALLTILAGVVGWSLVTLGTRTSQPAMPDQLVYQPPPQQPRLILVGVAGAVARPGLYWLPEGATVAQAIQAAGGTRADADLSAVALGRRVRNNEMVQVPARPRPAAYVPTPGVDTTRVGPAGVLSRAGTLRRTGSSAAASGRGGQALPPGQRININTAEPWELELLPGIGPALARRIVEYRKTHGYFRSAEDLQAVKGIGPKKAAEIAPYITF